jgi:hypothetical protein
MLDCGICYICVCYKRYLKHISHCLCFQLIFFLCIFFCFNYTRYLIQISHCLCFQPIFFLCLFFLLKLSHPFFFLIMSGFIFQSHSLIHFCFCFFMITPTSNVLHIHTCAI